MKIPFQCPCSDKPYVECCSSYLLGKKIPTTCEQLMRSRYTAFALKDVPYIEKTMIGPAKEDFDEEALKERLKDQEFVDLEIVETIERGNKGTVEFKAFFRIGSDGYYLHEKSEFVKQDGKWYYFDGDILS